ncbi:LysR family transcriptional regulator [Pseudoalteromonas luteoviolacea]|uniref:LysR family transcriptional regulator n=1 Tax=Pseudoalteromonas luteoviolacea TaxID=43657 RepID=A0A0C1QJ09_9GAMM|nr:LysR family transcriptional regulator [Pseudoalteromonas luteoviolacea]KID55087.1 LysR family transcriptional regulator [Pseudoalteromonas luteoviolacea]
MLKVTLEQWRMFKAVVEHGGFNQASAQIHKSQSSIHNAVNKIETSLGVKLFRVEGRKTRLTPAGELMLRRVDYLLEEASKVETIAENLAEGIETKLRIAIDEIFPAHLLYKVLDEVSQAFPFLRIELVESVLNGANEQLQSGLVDIAVSAFTLEGLFSEELCQIEFIAVASPKHALNQTENRLTLENLKSHRQIVVRDSAVSKSHDSGWLQASQRWTVSHMRTSIDMIKNGFGFAWLPVPLIEQELQCGELVPLNLQSGQTRKVQLHLTFVDGDSLGPAARAFLGELRYQSMMMPTAETSHS